MLNLATVDVTMEKRLEKSLKDLPEEIVLEIASYLTSKDVILLSHVCQNTFQACNSSGFKINFYLKAWQFYEYKYKF